MGAQFYVVGRPFQEGGRQYQGGDRVPAATVEAWRNGQRLIEGRWLRPTAEGLVDAARFGVVLRPFLHEGETLAVGTVVDWDGWRNVATLIAARWMREATDADLDAADTPPLVLDGQGGLEPAGATKGKGGGKVKRRGDEQPVH